MYERKKHSLKRLEILARAAFKNENVHVKQKHTGGRVCRNTLSDSAATCLLGGGGVSHAWSKCDKVILEKEVREVRKELKSVALQHLPH